MPCDVPWVYGDGQKTLIVLDEHLRGHSVVKAPPHYRGRESHFGTCKVMKAERAARRDGIELPTTITEVLEETTHGNS